MSTKPDQHPFPQFELLGVQYACVTPGALQSWLVRAAEDGIQGYLCISNVHTATLSWLDGRYGACQRRSLLSVPDGMPLVWSGKALGEPACRVYGPDLMWRTLDHGRQAGIRHGLIGGTDVLLAALKARIQKRLPGVNIAAAEAPPFLETEDPAWEEVWDRVGQARPQLTWVGLGAPKQELLMSRMAGRLPGLMVGVGQAFAINSGAAKQAPAWVQGWGLEWLYRLGQEPARLWRRYLLHNSLFLVAAPVDIARQMAAEIRRQS